MHRLKLTLKLCTVEEMASAWVASGMSFLSVTATRDGPPLPAHLVGWWKVHYGPQALPSPCLLLSDAFTSGASLTSQGQPLPRLLKF